ncbi:MAG: sensor histidine kinase [Alphaproteobacteria bacterium]|nr:MAG: sensor histidine kinase [Alphaproteobacteria bacterium]
MPRSLLGKIILNLSVITVLMLGLILVLLAQQFRMSAHVLVDRGLYDFAAQIGRSLHRRENGEVSVDLPPDIAASIEPDGPYGFTVNDIDGHVLARAPSTLTKALHPFRPHSESKIEYFQHVSDSEEESYYGATVQWQFGTQPVWIQVHTEAADEDHMDLIFETILRSSAWVVVPFFVLMAVANIIAIRHGLSPIRLASMQAAEIGPRSPGKRLPVEDMPTEVQPLVRAINAAFERMDRALENQRRFVSDLAHELLTPLAVIRAHIDTMEDQDAAAILRQDVTVISDVVTELLKLAELEATDQVPDQPVDLRAVCVSAISRLAPLGVSEGKEIALLGATTPVMVRGCERMLARAVGNLVKNALAHTPEGTTVEVRVAPEGTLATVQVMDRGPGVRPDIRDRIFERFWRGDDRHGPGAGLGLSIVKRIADIHGGRVTVGEAPGGGALFSLSLPRLQDPPAH